MNIDTSPAGAIRRWHIGAPGHPTGTDEGVVTLTVGEQSTGDGARLGFHEAVDAELPRATAVEIWLPAYRGKSLVPLLGWLAAARLAQPGAPVTWHLQKQQGPASVARMLSELNWRDVCRKRAGRSFLIAGVPPADLQLPPVACFDTVIGSHRLSFCADYGVFSPQQVDAGTALLAETVLREPAVEVMADIGIGYGALAVSLVRNGVARRAVGTDVDCLALWLAQRNAAVNNIPLDVLATPDPGQVESTSLTVCNVPTHVPAAQSVELMRALVARAARGRLLVVVHASLASRHAQHLTAAGLTVTRHPGPAHVVLACGG